MDILVNIESNGWGYDFCTESLNGVCFSSGSTLELAKTNFLNAFKLHLIGTKESGVISQKVTEKDFSFIYKRL